MIDELNCYEDNGHFFFKRSDTLEEVCNAPDGKAGVFIIYALKKGKIELVFMGRSEKINNDPSVLRKGGLRDKLLRGRRYGELIQQYWRRQMLKNNIEALDIYWFVTQNEKVNDKPADVLTDILYYHEDLHGKFPKWNEDESSPPRR